MRSPDEVLFCIFQVPFGKFAFMQGELYHTNEILVLLGDNWFVERSAHDAAAIAERRKQRKYLVMEVWVTTEVGVAYRGGQTA